MNRLTEVARGAACITVLVVCATVIIVCVRVVWLVLAAI